MTFKQISCLTENTTELTEIKILLDQYLKTMPQETYYCVPYWPGHFEYLLDVPEIQLLLHNRDCDYAEILCKLKRLLASEYSHQLRVHINVAAIASDLGIWYNKPKKGGLLMDRFSALFSKKAASHCTVSASANYLMGLDMIERYSKAGSALSLEEKISLLSFAIDAIARDIESDMRTAMFYAKPSAERPKLPFLSTYYGADGNEIQAFCDDTAEEKEVDLAKTIVWVQPYDEKKLAASLLRLKSIEFKHDPYNHFAYYLPEINVLFVSNGNHSITTGRYYRSGFIKAKVLDITQYFEHIDIVVDKKHSSDETGIYWSNIHTGEKLFSIDDFRVALLYKTCKIRFELEN